MSNVDAITDDGKQIEIRVLGPVGAAVNSHAVAVGGPKQRLLLAHLVASGAPARGSVLADEIWGDPSATDSVKTAVSRLRRVLGADVISHRSGGYLLESTAYTTDAATFAHHLERAREPESSLAFRIAEYDAALSCWRGPAYSDCETGACEAEAARLTEMRVVAISEQIGARLEADGSLDLVPVLESLVAEHPWREIFTEQLMVALYRSRRQRDALAAYRSLETTLIEELGVRPNPRAQALHLAIIEHDDARVRIDSGDPRLARAAANSSRGAPVAVGRADELARLRRSVDRTRLDGRARVVVVAGPPGIGKTTLLDTFATTPGNPPVARAAGTQNDPIAFFTVATIVEGLVALGGASSSIDMTDLELVLPGGSAGRSGAHVVVDRDLRRLRLQRAIENLFAATLAEGPLVVAIDDLHWVDHASMAVLGRLALRLADQPLTLILSCRTSEMTERGPVSGFLADTCQHLPSNTIELGGLDETSIRELIALRGGEPSAAISGPLQRATGGNPFFVVEWLRNHADRLADDVVHAQTTTVQQTITDRIDGLPPRVVDVLTFAAVLGQAFAAHTVASVADVFAGEVSTALVACSDAGLTLAAPMGTATSSLMRSFGKFCSSA